MDNKFRSILALAMHPDTGPGEVAAALDAARRMTATHGFDALMSTPGRVPAGEKIIYKTKPRETEYELTAEYLVPARWQHFWIKLIVQEAALNNVDFNIVECATDNGTIHGNLKIKFKVGGRATDVRQYRRRLDGDLAKINSIAAADKFKWANSHNDTKTSNNKGWWTKLTECLKGTG